MGSVNLQSVVNDSFEGEEVLKRIICCELNFSLDVIGFVEREVYEICSLHSQSLFSIGGHLVKKLAHTPFVIGWNPPVLHELN
jgi:hypothetical protein